MHLRELERIQAVTRHFGDLKGLEDAVPMGLIVVGMGLSQLLRGRIGEALLGLLAAAALLIALYARRFYRERYGEVESLPAAGGPAAVSLDRPRYFGGIPVPGQRVKRHPVRRRRDSEELVLWFLGSQTLVAIPTFGWLQPLRAAQLSLLLLVVLLLRRWVRLEMPTGVYPVLASLVFALAGVGSSSFLGSGPVLGRPGADFVLGGGVWILVGLFDHRTLTKALFPPGRPGLAADGLLPQEERE